MEALFSRRGCRFADRSAPLARGIQMDFLRPSRSETMLMLLHDKKEVRKERASELFFGREVPGYGEVLFAGCVWRDACAVICARRGEEFECFGDA